jgi:hypothetical protein
VDLFQHRLVTVAEHAGTKCGAQRWRPGLSSQPFSGRPQFRSFDMSLGTILIIILILLLIGAIPSWPYSSGWGYGPSGILGVLLVIVLILLLLGRI